MSLKHELCSSRARVPELNTAILGAGQDPVGVRGQRNGQDKVPVALKRLDALAALGTGAGRAARRAELPHLDRAIQTAADEVLAVGRERHRVDAVLVPIGALETLDQEARHDVPDTNALIQRAGGNKLRVGRNGNGGDAILNRQRQGVGALLNVPQTDSPVTTARSDGAAVARKVERVNVLLVAREVVADSSSGNIPHLGRKIKKLANIRLESARG